MAVTHILPQAACSSATAPRPDQDGLRIALVNNLPDAALRATERQFCALLDRASAGLTIRLDLYTLPGIARGRDAQAHLAAYYEDFDELQYETFDGIIVTGTEPHRSRLPEEAFWPSFTRLFDFVRQTKTPAIWCCLSAHAAVLYADGIERARLPGKLSGLFDSDIKPRAHDLLRGLPKSWRMPQSRLHGLPEQALVERGYEIAARSRLTGADIFFKRDPACQMFLQGHPEYSAMSLVAEYRRDVIRFLHGQRNDLPAPPHQLFPQKILRRLRRFHDDAACKRNAGQIAALDTILGGLSLRATWAGAACKLYTNWITHLSEVACEVPRLTDWQWPARSLVPARIFAEAQAAE